MPAVSAVANSSWHRVTAMNPKVESSTERQTRKSFVFTLDRKKGVSVAENPVTLRQK